MLKQATHWLANNRQRLVLPLLIFIPISAVYLIKLGGFIKGDSSRESIQYLGINGLSNLLQDPSFGPIKFFELIMVKIDQPNATLLRLVSTAAVLLSFILFYRVIAKWHTERVAILGTILFAFSSYSLHLGRYTLQDAMYYLVIPALILFGTWLKSKKNVNKVIFILPACALLTYLPGAVILFAFLGTVFRRRLILAWTFMAKRNRIIAALATALLSLPLLISIALHPNQIIKILGIDRLGADGIRATLQSFSDIFTGIFIYGPDTPYRWLSGTPVLDIASVVLLILGLYTYLKGPHTLRLRLIGAMIVISVLIIGLSTAATLALLMPLLYIVIAAGIAYLINSWLTVFPKNPAAKKFGIGFLTIFLLFIASYHLQRYFIAWPNTPATIDSLVSTER